MSSRDRDPDRDEDLEARLDELESVLSELQDDLVETQRDRLFRLPNPTELLRFTEQYTIPALIALLETTIRSLELLRATLRLADPGRGLESETDAARDRLAGVREEASAGLARSLSELRTALSESNLPEEATSRDILEDAKDLTAEIEARIEESREQANRRTGSESTSESRDVSTDSVRIDVTGPDKDGSGTAEPDRDEASASDEESDPGVDVEAELESIRRDLNAVDEAEADPESDVDADSGPKPDADRGDEPHSNGEQSDGDRSDEDRSNGDRPGDSDSQ